MYIFRHKFSWRELLIRFTVWPLFILTLFFHFTVFGFKNAKLILYKQKRFCVQLSICGTSGYKLVYPTWKNTTHLKFCLGQIFYAIIEISHFSRFLKIISSTC